MAASESENEDFQSADEFVSDEETDITVKINESLSKPVVPCVGPVVEEIVRQDSDDDTATAQPEGYRKRPERRRPPEDPKPKIIRPDAILSDLTGHLTSEFSKGFASLTTTSSSLGSKMGSLVKEIVSVKNEEEVEFEYDDDRTVDKSEPVRSAINDEIMKLSDAFVKLNEARAKAEENTVEEKTGEVIVVSETTGEEHSQTDGWETWGEEDAEEKTVEKESGWDHVVDAEVEQKDNDGWDDWGDEDETRNPDKKEEESWGDWEFEEIQPQKRQLGSQAAQPPQEWTGWDSFGQKSTWGAGWGINSLLNTATAVTTNLSQGISTVIESGLGVPDAETLARMHKDEERNQVKQPEADLFPLRNFVAGVGKIVEVAKVQEIGSRVLSGGLDTLETIGKKTMEVLQEGDPGLKKKRALIVHQGQMLSQVLKEARDRAVVENRSHAVTRRQFETVFDDFQGLVHLEALEMLSKQCEIQLDTIKQSSPSHKLQELLDTLDEVNQLCEIDEEFDDVESGDFGTDIVKVALPLKNELSVDKILQVSMRSKFGMG